MNDWESDDFYTFDDHLSERLRDPEWRKNWAGEAALVRLGRRLFRERTKRGISQEKLAQAVGTAQPNISSIENGSANPTVRTLGRIAGALELDVSELLKGEDRFGVFGESFSSTKVEVSSGAPEGVVVHGEPWTEGKAHLSFERREYELQETSAAADALELVS